MKKVIIQEVKDRFLKNGAWLQEIADKRNKNFGTVYKWFLNDHEKLLNIEVLAIIEKITGLPQSQFLEEKQLITA